MIKLSSSIINKEYVIKENSASSLLKERLLSLGFVNNSVIIKIKQGRKNSMDIYLIKGMMIALRQEEADCIWVI